MATTDGDASVEAPAAAPSSTLSETEVKSPPTEAKVEEQPAAPAATAGTAAEADQAGAADKPTEPKPDEKPAVAEAVAEKPAAAPSGVDPFAEKLPELIKEAGHDEMWGVKLADASVTEPSVPVAIVLQKFLNANDGDLSKAADQLKAALVFRKEKKPLELLGKTFSKSKFGDLGAVTVYPVKASAVPEIFTWNLYGNVKDRMDDVFVPLDEFMDYRIALQELAIQQLHLERATEGITATADPYKITQVHDYKSVSFFRPNPNVKAASSEVIKQFATAYPELLKEKFFVNVPAVMGWMYALIKLFVAPKTAKKFHPMSNGVNLAAEFKGGLDTALLPKEYGGASGAGDGSLKGVSGLVDGLEFA